MGPALIPAQITALTALHKDLANLEAAEGKGGPSAAAAIAAMRAELLALYQTLLGIPTK